MRRDGIAFVALMLFIAWITNILGTIFSTIGLIGVIYITFRILVAWLNQKPQVVNGETTYYSHTLLENNLPPELRNIEQLALFHLNSPGATSRTIIGKFLGEIGITNGTAIFPDYFNNAIAKKIMWEYYQKFGNLNFPVGSRVEKLSYKEVLNPIPPTLVTDFHNFCQQHTI